jgi:hypothetical protein
MHGEKFAKRAVLIGAVVGMLQCVSSAATTIYFTDGDSTQSLPQIGDHSAAVSATFTPASTLLGGYNVLDVTGGNGEYVPGYATDIAGGSGVNTGYVAIGGFAPVTDDIYVALKIDDAGTPLSSDQISSLITAIGSDPGYAGASVSTVNFPFTNVFAGYSILLSFPENINRPAVGDLGQGQYDVGFDFSSINTDYDVVAAGVVPEPTSVGVLCAAGLVLLSRRRRNRA